ncbi:HNH endonuclease signature motif containing protein [Dietzia psychralcaliphila]|uniref:HNH endonuclease signature motif containing protein n=1 Tax=Dietzia psychralcaliphila TaxID=139021 RepID=UPI0020A6770D|nr:HNH endonuclease signature motif containing protein [Dietzia psychralcaliphila]
MTTTSSAAFGALRAVPEALDTLGAEALSEVARSATVAQNLAAATRLQAAHLLVEAMGRLDREAHGPDPCRQPGDSRPADSRPADSRPAYARLDPADRARDHLTAAMSLTGWHAARLVTAGVQIHTRLPLLRKAVERGLLPEQLAIDTACRLAEVPDQIIAAVESEIVGALARDLDGGHRPSRTALDTAVDAARERHDPRAAEDAVGAAVEQRTVRFRPGRDGMTNMWATLPSGAAEKLRRRIEAAARAASEAGHPRTRDQLRADALCALGDPNTNDIGTALHAAENATDPAAAGSARPRPGASWGTEQPIRISIIDSIAQGLPNRVQFVNGAYSSFDWLCEELLSGGEAKVRFELIDPQPGVLDTPDAVLKYFITPALAERIRLRDGTCRHPGCTVDAHDCEIDHIIAFDHLRPEMGGPTAEWNLICLCRKHHREKTFGHCAYKPGPLGELTIITETGHEHRTTPHGPLAQARDRILDHRWRQHLDRLIADDGHLTNPPGSERNSCHGSIRLSGA